MISLTVDGEQLDFDLAGTIFQSEPFPGGHLYTLDISVDRELFDFLEPGSQHERPSLDVASRVLGSLRPYLRAKSNRHCIYYLNSIHNLTVSKDYRLFLDGVCSEFIDDWNNLRLEAMRKLKISR